MNKTSQIAREIFEFVKVCNTEHKCSNAYTHGKEGEYGRRISGKRRENNRIRSLF